MTSTSVGVDLVPVRTVTTSSWEFEAQAAAVAAAEAIAAAAAADVAAEAVATAEAAVIVAKAAAARATAKASHVAAQARRAAASAATNIARQVSLAGQRDPDAANNHGAPGSVLAALPSDPEAAGHAKAAMAAASVATSKVAEAVFAAASAAADAVFHAAAVAATAVLEAEALIEVQLTRGSGVAVAPPVEVEPVPATGIASAVRQSGIEVRDAMSRRRALGGSVTVAHGLEPMLRMHGQGASMNTIAAALNAEGYRRADGTRWHRTSVTFVVGTYDG